MYVSMLETEDDRKVFQELYEANRQKLYFMALKVVQNEENAEDAVHTSFLKLAENFAKYRQKSYENLEKLCGTIVVNTANDMARAYARRGEVAGEGEEYLPDIAPDILEQLLEQNDRRLIAEALMELKDEERHLLYLQYGLEIKPKEIGELLNMTSASVRRKMLRCRNKLAKILEDEKYECLR